MGGGMMDEKTLARAIVEGDTETNTKENDA